ncbi:uncharacterized protein LOC117912174 [Vitis riparia]|uniref:uncharacterized protein LOC117912174 n=1 Tax=Vitis riparia TaxID=96939 RepID=UPI00155A780B|nr:uncharacterized protein LOC117912174 [Vitis riparia]
MLAICSSNGQGNSDKNSRSSFKMHLLPRVKSVGAGVDSRTRNQNSPAWFQKNARNCDEKEPPEVFTKGDELLSSPKILFHIQSPHLQTLPFYIVAPSSSIEECLVFRRTYTEIFWALTFSISGAYGKHSRGEQNRREEVLSLNWKSHRMFRYISLASIKNATTGDSSLRCNIFRHDAKFHGAIATNGPLNCHSIYFE